MRKYILFLLLSLGLTAQAQRYLYWFDAHLDQAIQGTATSESVMLDADVSALSTGLHTLNYALLDEDGSVTSVRFALFLKTTQAKRYAYWFDNHPEEAVSAEATEGLLQIDADVSALAAGFHTLNYALLADDGSVSDVRFVNFLKTEELVADRLRLVYSIDDGESAMSEDPQIGADMYRFSIDVAHLPSGEHSLSYMLTDGSHTYDTGQAYFTKTEVDGIDQVIFGKDADDATYTLGGVRAGARDKGLYIIGGKKLIK